MRPRKSDPLIAVSHLCHSYRWDSQVLGTKYQRPGDAVCIVSESFEQLYTRGLLLTLQCVSAQIGDGTSGTNRLTPVEVTGLGSGVQLIALGGVRLFVFCFFCTVCIVFHHVWCFGSPHVHSYLVWDAARWQLCWVKKYIIILLSAFHFLVIYVWNMPDVMIAATFLRPSQRRDGQLLGIQWFWPSDAFFFIHNALRQFTHAFLDGLTICVSSDRRRHIRSKSTYTCWS